MPYSVSYESRPGYLYVQIEGPESYDEAVGFWENLATKSIDENIRKILIMDKVTDRLTTLEIFKLSEIISELFSTFSDKKIAFIDSKDETFDDNKFGETVIANRGRRAKLFHSEDEGLEWLLKVQE